MAKPPIKPVKQRNPVARSPLLKKGGAHETPKGGMRQQLKRDLESEIATDEATGEESAPQT